MKGRTRKYRSDSYSWDTETASYDATIYTSGGVMATVYLDIINDNKPDESIVKTFKSFAMAQQFVEAQRAAVL